MSGLSDKIRMFDTKQTCYRCGCEKALLDVYSDYLTVDY